MFQNLTTNQKLSKSFSRKRKITTFFDENRIRKAICDRDDFLLTSKEIEDYKCRLTGEKKKRLLKG
jgi:hypothetical protein